MDLVLAVTLALLTVSEGSLSGRYSNIKVHLSPARLITKDEVCAKAVVEISVSCQLDEKQSRRLVVSWWVPDWLPMDVMYLYLSDPAVNLTHPVYSLTPHNSSGWSLTPLQETFLDYHPVYTPLCLGYWVVYWRDYTKLASSCLQTNPRWMTDYRENVGRVRLSQLFIPGTHDSAAYSVIYHPRSLGRYEKYVYTQVLYNRRSGHFDESVLSQLLHGVRYLDLRVGHDDGQFFTYHGFVKLRHFQGVIDDVIQFLNNSRDIVIMDLHHFPVGFKNIKVHLDMVQYLERELGPWMATPALSWQATLEDVWRAGKQLIVSYNHGEMVTRHTHRLWPRVRHLWGDVRTTDQLDQYLDSIMISRTSEAWAAMAQVTPGRWDVLLDSLGGLRASATTTNPLVTTRLRQRWGRYANIVAVDFVRSSGLVSAAIHWNLLKDFHFCT